MTNKTNHRNAQNQYDGFLKSNVSAVVDQVKQIKPIAVQTPLIPEHVYHTDNNAELAKKLNIKLNSQSYIGEVEGKVNLAAPTSGVAQVQTLTFDNPNAAAGNATGNFSCYLTSLVQNYNKHSNNMNITATLAHTTTAAQLETALNALPIVQLYGSLDVVLTAGTIALHTAVFTITWRSMGVKPIIYGNANLADTTVYGASYIASAVTSAGLGYKDNVGLYMFDRIKLKSGNTEVFDWDYKAVMDIVLDRMPKDRIEELWERTGGYDFESGYVYVPIPVPWSELWSEAYNHLDPHTHWYPAGAIKEELEFELTFASAAQLCDSGATGNLSGFELHHEEGEMDEKTMAVHKDEIKRSGWQMRALHFETVSKNAIVTATLTDVDLSNFTSQGSAKFYYLHLIKSASITANDYYEGEPITELRLKDDNRKMFDDITEAIDIESRHRYKLGKRPGSLYGKRYMINFGSGNLHNLFDYYGAWNKMKINEITLQVKHAAGENCNLYVTAAIFVDLVVNQNGQFRRVYGGDLYS